MGVKGKYFMIASAETGLVLDVKGASTEPGSEVVMWERTGNDNQLWYEDPVTGTVRSKHSHLCLDFDGKRLQGDPRKVCHCRILGANKIRFLVNIGVSDK